MTDILVYITLGGVAIAIILLIILLVKSSKNGNDNRKIDGIIRSVGSLKTSMQSGFNYMNRTVTDGNARVEASVAQSRTDMLKTQNDQQQKLFMSLNQQNEKTNAVLSESIDKLQQSNEHKLEQMRLTVDEKLQKTLNERIDSSFKNVGEQLEKLYKSMGEMKNLSEGVNDLQRLLTNVKARGTWAEVQLGEILEQFLTSEQFSRNVSTKNNADYVEYAVKIPSKEKDGEYIWLPIDSKFPQEDYLRLQQAADNCDKAAVQEAEKALAKIIKNEAAKISKLYINVPKTTNFAIMFLPTEGLYAEVLRDQGLVEEIQRKYSVVICGPTTISAFLNTLRVGFRTIAINKQQTEVWKILGAAKQQYVMFEDALVTAKKKIDAAGTALDNASSRNHIIQKHLRKVEDVSAEESNEILGLDESDIV